MKNSRNTTIEKVKGSVKKPLKSTSNVL